MHVITARKETYGRHIVLYFFQKKGARRFVVLYINKYIVLRKCIIINLPRQETIVLLLLLLLLQLLLRLPQLKPAVTHACKKEGRNLWSRQIDHIARNMLLCLRPYWLGQESFFCNCSTYWAKAVAVHCNSVVYRICQIMLLQKWNKAFALKSHFFVIFFSI